MVKNLLKKFFWIYREELFKLSYNDKKDISLKDNVSFIKIDIENYKEVSNIRPGLLYINDFRKMLSYGDYGIYVCVDNIPVGYGWAKIETSKDYFFHIKNCYLCRFYVNPDFRGRNLYPATILQLMHTFNNIGTHTFYIAAETSNKSSLNGIRKIGFTYIKTLNFYRLLKITLNKYTLQ